MKIKLIKFNDNYSINRKHYNDAGADVGIPADIIIPANSTIKIPLGFGVEIPDGMCGLIITRSSIAAKGILVHIPPIDSGYRGEVHAVVTNLNGYDINMNKGDRIAQLIILPIIIGEFVDQLGSERGNGAFGSTGI